ncbi:MAG: NUDIX hydrolase [Candidatus Levybacteria bacterium GW2011_GWA2_40_8]|nr:MAG: NUDIX hydrolase [Candidatus Levybacteria bacterium GW2011_GWA2_40_8]
MDRWKTLSKKTLLTSELFEVTQTKFKLPNGKIKVREDVIRKPTVCVFPVDGQNIYLISEYRELWDERMLHAVAGFVDKKGETILDTAKRELMEEAGLQASQWEEISRYRLAASVIKGTTSLFLARDLEFSKQNLMDDEKIKVVKLSLKDAVSKVLTGEISDSATMVGILMIEKLRRQKKI